jgi:TolA-binding protein
VKRKGFGSFGKIYKFNLKVGYPNGGAFLINLKYEVQNYPPIDIRDLVENVIDIPDNIRNSITLYNKALENIKMDSEDIAVIELKKAISMNPNFHEAMNLLGLCYSYTKDYLKASEIFEKVIEAENNSIKALKYLGQLNSNDSTFSVQESKKNIRKNAKIKTEKIGDPWFKDLFILSKINNRDILKYLIGFVCGALVLFLISSAFYFRSKPVSEISVSDKMKETAASAKIKEDESKIEKLAEENKKLQDDLQAAQTDNDYYKNAFKLLDIDKLVSSKNYEAAADKLVLLKTFQFKGPEKDKYDALYNDVMPKAAWSVFNDGYNLLLGKKYQEALTKLNKVQIYGDNWAYMDLTLYYIGSCYKEMDDSRDAIAAFQKLKESYPKSKYLIWADNKIKELTAVP